MINTITKLKNVALEKLNSFLMDKLASTNPTQHKRLQMLSYWIIDYVKLLKNEELLRNSNYRRYNRGAYIKVHLGYRIGSEEGGFHYAIVLNKHDTVRNTVLTIIPLTSVKRPEQLERLNINSVSLGDELFMLLSNKYSADNTNEEIRKELAKMKLGSIGMVNQITTISKLRIYDPFSSKGILSGITCSEKTLDTIDKKIIELFTHP